MVRALIFDPTAGQRFAEQWERLDWQLLQNSHVHRYRDEAALQATCTGLTELGYLVHRLDAQAWVDTAGIHAALAAALNFPAYYGRNLDALDDVLGDVAQFDYGSDPAAAGTVLAVTGYGLFAEREPDTAQAVLDIFAGNARLGLLVSHPMLLLVTARQDFAAVGATPVMDTFPPAQPSRAPSE